MRGEARTVSELGEAGVIALFASALPKPSSGEVWSGDDAAVVGTDPGHLLITTDLMVEGEDFDLSYCTGEDVGWKAMAINVSDVAAMGGRPRRAVGTLALPPSTPVSLVEEIARGLARAAGRWEVDVVGGDVSAAAQISFGITLTGTPWGRVVTRSGAQPGDAICLTGSIGSSWGGLALLRGGDVPADPAARSLVERHLRPQPRVDEARRLAALGATSMIDVSDGLAIDLVRLMNASGTGCNVQPAALPLDPNLAILGLRAEELFAGAILGGEDYELIVTLPSDAVTEAGALVAVIGEVTPEPGVLSLGDDDLEELGRRGWDHLRGR